MDETEVIKEEQTESAPEPEEPETGDSDSSSDPVTRTETIVISDFGNVEELIQETNVLLLEQNELMQETNILLVEQNELLESVNSNFVVVSTLLGMLLGMLSVVIFGGAMNHDRS